MFETFRDYGKKAGQDMQGSFIPDPMYGYVLRSLKNDVPIGTIGRDGDFIPLNQKIPAQITSRQRKIIMPALAYQDGMPAPKPPENRRTGSLAADALNKVSDLRGGQIKKGTITW